MHIRPNAKTGSVIVAIPAREAMRLASELVRAAMASGSLADSERPEPPLDEDMEERER